MTHREIGKELGLSHTMVRKIKQKALQKLKENEDLKDLFGEVMKRGQVDNAIYNNW